MSATKKDVLREMRRHNDKSLFTSPLFAEYLRSAIAPCAHRYGLDYSVRTFWDSREDASLAFTDSVVYSVNTGHPEVMRISTKEERLMYILGEIVHEMGHGLFTNFQLLSLRKAAMANGDFFPEPPETDGTTSQTISLHELKEAMQDPVKAGVIRALVHELDNICEDGRIEMLLAQVTRGFVRKSLMYMRDSMYASFPSFSDLAAKLADPEYPAYIMLQNMLLCYSLYGKIKEFDQTPADARIKQVVHVFNQMIDTVDAAIFAPTAIGKTKLLNKLLLVGWPVIKPYVDRIAEKSQEPQAQQSQGQTGQSPQSGSGNGQGSQSNTANGQGLQSNAGNGQNAQSGDRAAQQTTQELRQNAPKGQLSTDNSERCSGHAPAAGDTQSAQAFGEKSGARPQGRQQGQQFAPDLSQSGDGTQRATVSADKDQRQSNTDDAPLSAVSGAGAVTRNGDYVSAADLEEAATALRGVLTQSARASLEAKEDQAFFVNLNDFVKSVKFTDTHKSVDIRVNRIAKVTEEMKHAYDATAGEYARIARETVRTVLSLLKPQNNSRVQNNKYAGTTFNANALVNRDLKVFGQKRIPGKNPSLAVALRVDESGSMSSASRASYARAAAITLQQFCELANIPCVIYGDTTSGEGVELYAYTDPERPSPDDKYRLMDIGARSSNRDGAAIQYVAERLVKTGADVKLCFIISDGQPNAVGYRGKAAEADLRGIVREYTRKANITFVAAAIGDDKEIIRRIYGPDRFLDISDVTRLPRQIANIVRRHI